MMHARTIVLAVLGCLGAPADGPATITFDAVETGKPMPSYTDQGVVFALSRPPTTSRAAGRVMFFPHLKTPRKGILNAMANESIPVEVRFPKPVASVTLVLWGSIGSEAVVEAYDADGNVVDRASRDAVPERTGPEQPIPSFELTVKASAIAYVRFSGAPPGGYLVCDEVRATPAADPARDPVAATGRERPIPRRHGGLVAPPRQPEAGGAGRRAVRLPHRRERVQARCPSTRGRASSASPRRTGSSTSPSDHRMKVVGHTLCWHSQSPAFLFRGPDGKPLPRDEALKNLKDHIDGVVGHFKGKVVGWDVVNEAISDAKGEYLRDTPARRAIGDDYIVKAFEFAHAADPDAELYYNDYGNEHPEKLEKTIRLIRELKAAGVRLDGGRDPVPLAAR